MILNQIRKKKENSAVETLNLNIFRFQRLIFRNWWNKKKFWKIFQIFQILFSFFFVLFPFFFVSFMIVFFFRFFTILLILRNINDEIWFQTWFIMFKILKSFFLYNFLMSVYSFFLKISIFMNCLCRKKFVDIILKLTETAKNAVLTVELRDVIKNNVLILVLNETINEFRSKNKEREKND